MSNSRDRRDRYNGGGGRSSGGSRGGYRDNDDRDR